MKKYLSFLLVFATLLSTTSVVACFGAQRIQSNVKICTDFAGKEDSNFCKKFNDFFARLIFCATACLLIYLYGYNKGHDENSLLFKWELCASRRSRNILVKKEDCGVPGEIIIWRLLKSEVNNFLSYFKGAK